MNDTAQRLSIKTSLELHKVRNKLQAIGQISWTFNSINKLHPIEELCEEDAVQILQAYKKLLQDALEVTKE